MALRITLDLEKSLEQNASDYFDAAKKAKKKLEGAQKALRIATEKANSEEKDYEIKKAKQADKAKEKSRKKQWYEKFRWFITSDDFLVIAGRDSGSNEEVIKKHAENKDLVFHTDAPGSPFTIIKNLEKKEIPKSSINEAAAFTATFSRAWELNIKSMEVFMISPEQVTKQAKAGEYVQKGAFMIYGKREYQTAIVSLAIGLIGKNDTGVKEDKEYASDKGNTQVLEENEEKIVMSGPLSAVRVHCKKFIELRQGDLKKSDAANKIMKTLGLALNEDILSALPSGKFGFVKK